MHRRAEKSRETKGENKTKQKANRPEHEQFFVIDLDLHAAVLWEQHLICMLRALPAKQLGTTQPCRLI
jgi:hypothetical protein